MGLRENLANEPVRRLNVREPVIGRPGQTVREVVERMRERELGCVILVDDVGKPVGVFNEHMLRSLLALNADFLADPIEKHMAERFPWVSEDDAVEDVLTAMQTNNTRFLCVVDGDGKVVGLTGQKGLMEYIAEHFPEQVLVQRVGVSPFPSSREGA
ncbi:MAG: CBS domain-containing protein [Planctomycetales bacterium]|nr:CBS domain-containing protein [Planctomycetales bacterium]